MSDKTPVDDPSELTVVNNELTEGRREEPPVVARLVVEIRSDGSRTIARGALEERESGQTVAVEAVGDSPLRLALSLAKVIASAPLMARTAAKAMLPPASRAKKPTRRARARRLLRRIRRGPSDSRSDPRSDDDDR